jgi:hypothetical protein
MSKHVKALIAGTSVAILTSAPIFADDTTEILNGQINLDAAISVSATGVTPEADSASMNAIGIANALTVDVVTPHDIVSTQTVSGSVATSATTSVGSIDGAAITTSNAMGNSTSIMVDDGMDVDSTQTALDGTTISANAQLDVSSYTMTSATTAAATANAYESTAYGGEANLFLRQDSGADVTADAYVLAPTAGLGWAATVLGAANGNSVSVEGYDDGPSQVVDVDQSNRGDVRGIARLEAGGGAEAGQVIASANGNAVRIQNENGYAHLQGDQVNDGQVDAEAEIIVGNFDVDIFTASAEAAGNSAIISNIGADAFMGVGQVNNGAVNARSNFTGDSGGGALLSATAWGNAATTYICSECPVTAWGDTNQVNNAAIASTVTGQVNSGGVLNGTATAIGNSATYQTINPHTGD